LISGSFSYSNGVPASPKPVRPRPDIGRPDSASDEEVRHRHVEHLGEFIEPAQTDAVGAALVFLDLLEGEPDGRPELLLAHPEKRGTHPRKAAWRGIGS
jgi:hypothetical protein